MKKACTKQHEEYKFRNTDEVVGDRSWLII